MQDPFPALTHLHLGAYPEYDAPIIPDSFLGGSAPLLRSLYVRDFVYPALPKLLLSATGLASLSLFDRVTCYIPHQMMVDCVTSLARLETLVIQSRLNWHYEGYHLRLGPRPPPLTQHTDLRLLPVLTTLAFQGPPEYFEMIFTRIDAPRLEDIKIGFNDPPIFNFSRISLFTSLKVKETFEALDQAHMGIESNAFVNVTLS